MHFRKGGQALLTLEDRAIRLTLAGVFAAWEPAIAPAPSSPSSCPCRRRRAARSPATTAASSPTTSTSRSGPRSRPTSAIGLSRPARLDRAPPRPHAQAPAAPTNLAEVTDADIARLVRNLNTTPRKCLDWSTPLEAFSRGLADELRRNFTVGHLNAIRLPLLGQDRRCSCFELSGMAIAAPDDLVPIGPARRRSPSGVVPSLHSI